MKTNKIAKYILVFGLIFSLILVAGCGAKKETTNEPEKKEANFPERPIQIVVPWSAGGGSDLIARTMAGVAEQHLGTSLVAVNKTGGSGTVGTSYAAHAKPDGYTLVMGVIGPLTMQTHYGGTDYTLADLEPIAQVCNVPIVFAVSADAPYKTLQEFIDYAKDHPGEIKYGNSAAGGAPHLAIEMFASKAGIDIKAMPFKGAAPAVTACVGGHIQAIVAHPSELKSHIDAGTLRPLAVAEPDRIEVMPDIPTFKEQGVDVQLGVWKGVAAPKGLPEDVKQKLVEGFGKIINDETFVKMMTKMGETVNYLDAEQFSKKWEEYDPAMKEVITNLGMYGKNSK